MSNQSATTNAPAEPTLCKMGCGFFGSNAFGDCCSKCFHAKKKEGNNSVASTPAPVAQETPAPMELELSPPSLAAVESSENIETTAVVEHPKSEEKKRMKKKKTSYKSMMADMTKRTKDENDINREKEGLRKVTGGGTFAKIDRI